MTFNPLGEWMRARRKQLDMTQEDLARRTGCARVTIQKIEEGARRPSRSLAATLAKAMALDDPDTTQFIDMARSTAGGFPGVEAEAARTRPIRSRLAEKAFLPTPLSSFIGRRSEIAEIRRLLVTQGVRLLTLTGPPGVGKTRLSIAAASTLKDAFPDGVHFVPLAAIQDPALVIPNLAHTLGFGQSGARPLLDRLRTSLRSRRLLLVIDNFEQVVSAAADLAELLTACPGLYAVVSSRNSLSLVGERVFSVEPFPLPDPSKSADVDEVLNWNAVQLFVERAQAFLPGFRLTQENTGDILEICSRLDGLPLAIELAAARLPVYTPKMMLEAFHHPGGPLPLLHRPPGDLPSRQQTLFNTIAWSYALLDEPQKRVFRGVSIFAGGCTEDAALKVCLAADEDLHALSAHQLVRRSAPGERLSMLEMLRLFAAEFRDANAETPGLLLRHACYYHELAVALNNETETPIQEKLARFEAEHDNLRAALRTLIDAGDGARGVELCILLSKYWEYGGYQHEGLAWMKEVLPLSEMTPTRMQIELWGSICTLSWQTGDFPEAERYSQQALDSIRPFGWREDEAWELMEQGRIAIEQGDYAKAERVLNLGLEIARSISNPLQCAWILMHLAEAAIARADFTTAEQLCIEGLAISPDAPAQVGDVLLIHHRGEIAQERGDFPSAWEYYQIALRAAAEVTARRPLTLVLAAIAGWLAESPGAAEADLCLAAQLWGAVEAWREISGFSFSAAHNQRFERQIDRARSMIDRRDWEAAWDNGRCMTLEDAVAEAQQTPHHLMRVETFGGERLQNHSH